MTLLDRLRAHRGGLVRLKTQLYWYGGRGWDKNPGRICLILDADTADTADTATRYSSAAAAAARVDAAAALVVAAALLLVDGSPQWVWVVAKDIELLDGEPQ